MKLKLNLKSIIVAIIFVVLIVGYYWYLNGRNTSLAENKADLTDVQMLITEDLEKNYPKTPREVVKLYNRLLLCYYNEEYTEEEFESMVDQAMKLFDPDLIAKNPKDQYMIDLKTDIDSYHEDGKTISNITIEGSKDVQYETLGADECAYVDCVYYVREGSSYDAIRQTYMLRKDASGKWKILAFFLTPVEPLLEEQNGTGT